MLFLCRADGIEDDQSRGFKLAGHDLLLIRQGGRLYLYRNRCPHRGINLEWMPDRFLDPEKAYIQCATHGALFTIAEGHCVAGPCRGQKLQAIPFAIIDGEVRVDPAHLTKGAGQSSTTGR